MKSLAWLLLFCANTALANFNTHCYLAETVTKARGVTYATDNQSTAYGCHLNLNKPIGLFHFAFHGEHLDNSQRFEPYEAYYDAGDGVTGWRVGRVPLHYGMHADNRIVRDTQHFMFYPPSIYRDNIWPTAQSVDGIGLYHSEEHVGFDHQHFYNAAIGAPIGLDNPALAHDFSGIKENTLSNGMGLSTSMKISSGIDDFRVDVQYLKAKQQFFAEDKEFARLLVGGRHYYGKTLDVSSEFMLIKVYDVGITSSSWNIGVNYQAAPKWRIHGYYDINCPGVRICGGNDEGANKTLSIFTDYAISTNAKLRAQVVRGTGAPSFNSIAVTSAEPHWTLTMVGVVLNFN
jgi:hypothetical protein